MMEGKFSGEGLQALDTDEDLMSAMARELVEKPESESPRLPEVEPELDGETVPVLDLPEASVASPAPTAFGIRLAETPSTSEKKRKKFGPRKGASGQLGPKVSFGDGKFSSDLAPHSSDRLHTFYWSGGRLSLSLSASRIPHALLLLEQQPVSCAR